MIQIKNKSDCCGCSACYSICPRNAISFEEDNEGFDYPNVITDICVNCNLCEKVCPIKQETIDCQRKYTIAIQNNDESIRQISSAGGFAGALFRQWFDSNSIVYAVGYDENNIPKFFRLSSMEDCLINRVFASKYVSCVVGDTYSNVKKDLSNGINVCFVGLPCQVAGLFSFLNKKYDNLFLVDLTCYGVPSRKLYREYLSFLTARYHKRIVDVRFRDKSFGYSAPTMCVEFEGGIIKSQNSNVKSFLRTFFSHLSIRPSCFNCHFKQIDRCSDLTIGDIKNIGKFNPSFDDNLGTTLVYVHSIKGETILKSLQSQLKICDIDIANVVSNKNNKMISNPEMNPHREMFFSEINSLDYKKLINKYCPASFEERIINVVKTLFLLLGLQKSRFFKAFKESLKKYH